MSPRRSTVSTGTLLDLWRPPHGAGDAVGCLATTYTFAPGLFDEQCLGRFLSIESEPNREDLAFLLDVNKDYQPWLVKTERLYEAMNTVDKGAGKKRGLLVLEAKQ